MSIKHNGEIVSDSALGNGTADAIFKVVDRISGINGITQRLQGHSLFLRAKMHLQRSM